jgi:hypothetical protein
MCFTARVLLTLTAAAFLPLSAKGQDPNIPLDPPSAPGRSVLDIERLRVVTAGRFPNDVPTCQVLVLGGGLGGVAAAEDLARQGISVILTEPSSHLGGQLTAQGVSTPDENSDIELAPGPGTRHYRELRDQVRALYARAPGILPGRSQNVGQCWVSRVSGEPAVWEQAIRDRLAPLAGPRGIRQILMRTQLLDIRRFPGNGQISYADVIALDTGRITRIGAQFVLDATQTGDALPLAGVPWTLGQEAQAEYGEPDAPPDAHPEWVQSFTYVFDTRWDPQGRPPTVPPDDYTVDRQSGEYTLAYDPSGTGPIQYLMLKRAPGAGGPFWTYRRLVAASSFAGNPAYVQDISQINWSGNDYREETFVGRPPDEQVRILQQAKEFAEGFLYWLQTECPRDDGSGNGYPEIQSAGDVLGGDGFAPVPYVREGRRLLAAETLTENDLIAAPASPDQKFGTDFPDSVGLAWYAIDIHPAQSEPPILRAALRYSLPLGAFIVRSGPKNLLPSASDWGASRLAMASARMHPTEWEAGEIAGHLAAFCLLRDCLPADVRATPGLQSDFQAQLVRDGIATHWSQVSLPHTP